jgi:hypothetical protein
MTTFEDVGAFEGWELSDESADEYTETAECNCEDCSQCGSRSGELDTIAAPRPRIRSTAALRNAWREYRCATNRMVSLRLFGRWNTPVNPKTVDAWRALESTLAAAGYDVHRAWVYVCRNIAGQKAASLHAYGLAIDIDHAKPRCNINNPTPDGRKVRFSSAATKSKRCRDVQRGTADTAFTPQQVSAVESIRTVDGQQVFAWGGRWTATKDTMHFQINVTPAELARGIDPTTVGAVAATANVNEAASEEYELNQLVAESVDAVSHEQPLAIPSTSPLAHRPDLDSALRTAFTTTGIALIVRTGSAYAVHRIAVPATSVPEPVVWNVPTVPAIHAVVLNGRMTYIPDATGAPRWVQMPRMKEFFALPQAAQGRQRDQWVKALRNRGVVLPPIDINRADSALLRVLLIWNATNVLPVHPVARMIGGVRRDRGGVVDGVTTPIARVPLNEPDCYLPVISDAEGRLESINAWDAGAGISLGPVQINAQRAALLQFLMAVWRNDQTLFTRILGPSTLGWSMRTHGSHPDLVATRGSTVITLHGSQTQNDVQRVIHYLHNGDPAKSTFDPDWRRRQAEAMRSLLAWPHIQELLLETTIDFLQPALSQIRRVGIGPFDSARPDEDTFVLTAILLSASVRFSGCLAPILRALSRRPTVAMKLAHWQSAVRTLRAPCKDLVPRLVAQQTTAQRVFRELTAGGGTGTGATTIREALTADQAWGAVVTMEDGEAADADEGDFHHGMPITLPIDRLPVTERI